MDVAEIHTIIQRIRDGDKEAYRHVIRAYRDMAYSIAISMVKQHEEAQDVVQNAFVQAYRHIHNFSGDAQFSTWLYRIVTNEALKSLRKNKKHKKVALQSAPSQSTKSDTNTALSSLETAEHRHHIDQVLHQMKPKEAMVLKLHYLHEMPTKEIHESTGWSISNIKTLLHRARKSFQIIYQEQYKSHEQ